ncbi:hypothetical protein ENUP19_0057G0075 [Entamoeba nuttalli]|uniref:Uncharacterized protein n=2 Tax=Entamoeba nuttalli TaxID=412467 RepID=K2H042_ENTNP|nr:hypothetical protein ENU1_078270 [Entamoeba nuttalli P19]EKE40828.1 hypothetical protein ENU1_078270 [Entamoeba nuttalli P19]|eukprot:XP_008856838.1 hypothetical protein ENU1_078270 [Entamoeba nuttalli P19]
MKWLVLLFILSCFATPCKFGLTPSSTELFDCLNSLNITADRAHKIKTSLKIAFEAYVYHDILKNPPQPKGYETYHYTVDIDQRMSEIEEVDQPFYPFYRKLNKLLFDLHDLHMYFGLESSKDYCYWIDLIGIVLPFTVSIKQTHEVLFSPLTEILMYDLKLPSEIIKNREVPVSSVDGVPVLDWIRNYSNTFSGLKSPHARFTYTRQTIGLFLIGDNPLTKEEIDHVFEIEYTNGVKVNCSYQIINFGPENQEDTNKALKVRQVKERIDKKRRNRAFNVQPILPSDLGLTHSKKDVLYDYELKDNIACKVITINSTTVNVLVIQSFAPQEYQLQSYVDVYKNCIESFDENNGPISVILPMNGGGYVDLEAFIEKTLAPSIDVNQIGDIRISDPSLRSLSLGYDELLNDVNSCQLIYSNLTTREEFYASSITVKYGNVEHVKTQTGIIQSAVTDLYFKKNPRNPTDIIVMTDAFCYSACSLLAKGMKERGNAILVGYLGDPEGEKELYDVGQSPSVVVSPETIFTEQQLSDMDSVSLTMQISFAETYLHDYSYNQTIPREFIIEPVDELQFLDSYNNRIELFASAALSLYNKYQTDCNPSNDRLVKRSQDCDSKITIEHAHGGYKCGVDGKWSDECVATYCDNGYFFDFYNKKCVIDVCGSTSESSSSSMNQDSESSSSSSMSHDSESSSSSSKSHDSESSANEPSQNSSWTILLWVVVGCIICAGLVMVIVIVVIIIRRKFFSSNSYNYSKVPEVPLN